MSAFTMHDALLPPPVKVPIPGLIEGPAFMGWPAGIISHKKALTVLVDGNPGVQQGHDVGYLIVHLAAPANAYIAINIAFSKHKVAFPVDTLKLGGGAAGTYLYFLLGIICAQPVSLPTGVLMIPRIRLRHEGEDHNVQARVHRVLISTLELGMYIVWHAAFYPPRPLLARRRAGQKGIAPELDGIDVFADGEQIPKYDNLADAVIAAQ
jgi:hypothetical protein